MKKVLLFLFIVFFAGNSQAQSAQDLHKMKHRVKRPYIPPNPLTIGLEQDVLPYLLKGFIATGWMGRDRFRTRFSYAQATSPNFFLADNVTEDRVKAFGISFEYFFRTDFNGWWVGPGIGYWTNYVTLTSGADLRNESFIFSFGGGYNFRLTDWLYTSPWVALHSRVSGNDAINIGTESFRPAVLTPEVSIKIGVKLGVGN